MKASSEVFNPDHTGWSDLTGRAAAINRNEVAIEAYDRELAKMSRLQRLIPLFGQAAVWRCGIKELQRRIVIIVQYWV